MIPRWLRVEKMGLHTAIRIVGLGMLMAGCGLAAPRVPALSSRLSTNGIDFVQGLCFGLALAFVIMGVTALVAAARAHNKNDRRKPE